MTTGLIPARPTTYKGIAMRSRLEAAYAEQFDAFGWQWEYEPQCFATDAGQYLPDFRLRAPHINECCTYVEVKPYIDYEHVGRLIEDQVPRWWNIIKANDPTASAFLLCVGADPEGQLEWYGLIDDWTRARHVCPVTVGVVSPHVAVMRDVRLDSFTLPSTGIPLPVTSLHGTQFRRTDGIDDEFDLRMNGC